MSKLVVGPIAFVLLASLSVSPSTSLESGARVAVDAIGVSTGVFHGNFGATRDTSSAGGDGPVGSTAGSYLAYGSVDAARGYALRNLCADYSAGSGDEPRPSERRSELLARDAAYFWIVESRVLPAELGKVALDVTWERWSRVGSPVPRRVAGDSRRIVMSEGERSVLDFVSLDPTTEDYCASNVQIVVTGRVLEDPEFASDSIRFDVWYEHLDSAGRATRRHGEAVGRQGEEVPFRFEPLRFPVPDRSFPDGVGAESIVEVGGTARARIQRDGSILVRLGASRTIGFERTGEPRRGGCGDGGAKIFSIESGETVRLTLPTPTCEHGLTVQTRTSTAGGGTSTTEHRLKLDDREFFAGSQDALVVTATRVR